MCVSSLPRTRGTPVGQELPSPSWPSASRSGTLIRSRAKSPRTSGSEAARGTRLRLLCPDDLPPLSATGSRLTASPSSTRTRPAWEAAASRRARRDHDRDGEREEPRVQPSRAGRADRAAEAPRALPLPDEGALAGPGPRARRAEGPEASVRRSTTATPRAERRWQIRKWSNLVLTEPGHAPRRRASTSRPLGRRAREPRATSSSTRRTSTAASSARTSATSFGACAASRVSTAPTRSSFSRRRRSRTPASSPMT